MNRIPVSTIHTFLFPVALPSATAQHGLRGDRDKILVKMTGEMTDLAFVEWMAASLRLPGLITTTQAHCPRVLALTSPPVSATGDTSIVPRAQKSIPSLRVTNCTPCKHLDTDRQYRAILLQQGTLPRPYDPYQITDIGSTHMYGPNIWTP